MRRFAVTVIGNKEGGSRWSEETARMAYEVGRVAAEIGFVVVHGGRTGVMREVARGCHEAGGFNIGILPGAEFDEANEFCDLVVPTAIGFARNVITACSGDVLVALPGGQGTLQEISYAISYGRPVLSWDSWTVHESIDSASTIDQVQDWLKQHFTRLTAGLD